MLLILAAPTLLGTRPVLSIILSKVNDRLNGHVEVSSLSLGWFSGIRIDGVRVFDQSKSQIAEIDHLTVPMPLWKVLFGHYALGNVVIDGLSCDARYDEQKRLNFTELAKPTSTTTETKPSGSERNKPSKLPTLSGDIRLVNCRATISRPHVPTVYLNKIAGEIKIPDLNQPITNSLKLMIRAGDKPEGTIALNGSAAVIKNSEVNTDLADLHEVLDVGDVDLQTVAPLLPTDAGLEKLNGLLGVHISIDVTGGKDAVVDAAITASHPSSGVTAPMSDPSHTDIHLSLTRANPGASVPDLRNLDFVIHSKSTNGEFKGKSLADLSGTLAANLTALHEEMLQFAPQMQYKFGGNVEIKVANAGQIDQPPYQSKLTLNISGNDVQYADAKSKAINEKRVTLALATELNGSARKPVEQAKNLTLALEIGDEAAPTIDLLADAPSIGLGDDISADFHLAHLTADLAKLQKEFKAVPAGTAGVVVNQGLVTASAQGSFKNHHVALDELKISAEHLFIARQLPTGQQINAVAGEALNVNTTGGVDLIPTADGKSTDMTVTLTSLTIADIANILDVHKTGGDFVFKDSSVNGLSGSGQLAVAVELGSINQIDKILKQNELVVKTAAGDLQTGKLTGTIELVSAEKSKAGISANFDISNMVLAGDPTAGKPIAPLQVTNGTLSLAGTLARADTATVIDITDLTLKNVAFRRGDIAYSAKPVMLKLQASSDKNLIQIKSLTGDLGLATLSMPMPITVDSSEAKSKINGSVKLTGNLSSLTELLAAYKGKKPDAYPYRGNYTLTENIISQQDTVSLKGDLEISKFETYDSKTITFSEDLLAVTHDVALTTTGEDQSVAITSMDVNMKSSGAMHIALSNGSIQHLQAARVLQLQPVIDYDLAKLWPIIQPAMGDKYKTVKVAGVFKKQFNISGSYPADKESTVAIKTLHADGDLTVTSFDYNGLNLQNLTVPFTMDNGLLVTVFANKPAGQNTATPAVANGGTLDLSDITVDLTQEPYRINIPANKALITNLTVNPLFANTFLKDYLNNPIFAGDQATGLFSLTMVDCNQLPLGDLLTSADPKNTGRADLRFSLVDLNIGFGGIPQLQSVLKTSSFKANVKDATLTIAKGMSTQHVSFATGQYTLSFDGTVRLKDEAYMPMAINIGPFNTLLDKTGVTHDPAVLKNLPDRISFPVKGTVSHSSINPFDAIGKAVADATGKGITNQILGGDKNGNSNNPIGGLLKGLKK